MFYSRVAPGLSIYTYHQHDRIFFRMVTPEYDLFSVVILFLVIIGVIIGFGALFMCSEREIANKRANKR